MFDAIVVGGSFAGLSAALQLARARRRIVVVDAGARRNRFAATSHGFLGQDGRAPGDIVADARAQLLAYPTVEWIDGEAARASGKADAFLLDTAGGDRLETRRIILSPGVTDELPAILGLRERWGRTVFHCPYCHGYELGDGPIGVLASSSASLHHALMLPDWGRTTLFLNDAFEPNDDERRQLEDRGVRIEAEAVAGISGEADIELSDGRVTSLAGLFTLTRTRPSSPLPEQLGCALEDGPMGPFIRTDGTAQTTVPGIFAAGDAARAVGLVAFAVAGGALAGAGTHRSLMFGLG